MGRRRISLPELGEDDELETPIAALPQRPTVTPLTDDNWQELKDKFEEGLLAGLSKDDAGAYAFMRQSDVIRLVAIELDKNPNWINDLLTVGKANLRATARVIAARKVRAGDASYVLPVVQATSPDLSPKHDPAPSGNTYNIILFKGDKVAVPSLSKATEIIDVKVE